MTEIPEHLRQRAEIARRRRELDTEPKTVEVPVELLIRLRDDEDLAAAVDDLVALIPTPPPYEPHPRLVEAYAKAQQFSTGAARMELIDLHNAGLTIVLSEDQR